MIRLLGKIAFTAMSRGFCCNWTMQLDQGNSARPAKCRLNDDDESSSEKRKSLEQGRRALRKRRWVERGRGYYGPVVPARNRAF
jgi:hypothetical protein